MNELMFGEHVRSICPSADKNTEFLNWPPDVFAICASALKTSGSYVNVLDNWPPALSKSKWLKDTEAEGLRWSRVAEKYGKWWWKNHFLKPAKREKLTIKTPEKILSLWKSIWELRDLPISDLCEERNLRKSHCLAEMVALADEACAGFGFQEAPRAAQDIFYATMQDQNLPSTLCLHVHWTRAIVLPKISTPQSGVTIRALTHHLSLISSNEVNPRWCGAGFEASKDSLNFLIIPWPLKLERSSFKAVSRSNQTSAALPKTQGQFAVEVKSLSDKDLKCICSIIANALKEVNWIDQIILPELAMADEDDYVKVLSLIPDLFADYVKGSKLKQTFLISGVAKDEKGVACNEVATTLCMWNDGNWEMEPQLQHKHHNWKLDSDQIYRYGLNYHLSPRRSWWEKNYLDKRKINFHLSHEWLNFCVVICEDLARPDPTAELIRSVGPNLVIALLMDGPQLTTRWSSRYATVLADDPGASVLTLTSLGMTKLSCQQGEVQSREIALWKNCYGQITPIHLPEDASAMLLHLERKISEEWTLDGRSDNAATSKVLLKGLIPVIV